MRSITLSEYLRPWALAGVTHFLPNPDAQTEDIALEEGNVDALTLSSNSLLPAQEEGVSRTFPSSSFQRSPEHTPKQVPPKAGSVADNQLPREKVVSQPQAVVPDKPLSQEKWPQQWQVLFAKVKPAPVVWTYHELGFDLTGGGSAERSACLKQIIGNLGLPRGSSSFWPFALPEGNKQLVVNLEVFKSGLSLLQPQVVVVAGINDTLATIDERLSIRMPFTQQVFGGRLYVLIPDFSQLVLSADAIAKTCAYLRTAFSGIAALH